MTDTNAIHCMLGSMEILPDSSEDRAIRILEVKWWYFTDNKILFYPSTGNRLAAPNSKPYVSVTVQITAPATTATWMLDPSTMEFVYGEFHNPHALSLASCWVLKDRIKYDSSYFDGAIKAKILDELENILRDIV